MLTTLFWKKQMQSTLPKLKSMVLKGIYHIVFHRFSNKLYYLSKLQLRPTELQNVEKSKFLKEANSHNFWTFELDTHKRINVPIWIFLDFQQRDRQASQNLNNDTYYRPPTTNAQCIFGTEKYPDFGILIN